MAAEDDTVSLETQVEMDPESEFEVRFSGVLYIYLAIPSYQKALHAVDT
jgi:hypothetical protein